jgi:UDP-N-acetylglucosamine 2-epimerase (non-hydrolysing)
MSKKKIIIGFGTRPELIKLFPLIIELKKNFNIFILNTGQHDELLRDILKYFNLKLNKNLNLMKKNQNSEQLISSIVLNVSPILKKINPNLVIVHGDTSSSLALALASSYSKIKIAHIEAGLRTHIKNEPFPEEINRKTIGSLTDFHFAPTIQAKKNLINEGIKKNIYVTGNTIVDAVKVITSISNENDIKNYLEKKLKINFKNKKDIVLITCHRRENFNQNIKIISQTIIKLSKIYNDKLFIFPVHPNPNIKNEVYKYISKQNNIMLTDPIRYDRFLYLFKKSKLLISDSGGIQEECYCFRTPVILLRNYTERPEAVSNKLVHLSKINEIQIINLFNKLINKKFKYIKKNPYGNGKASLKINNVLIKNIC